MNLNLVRKIDYWIGVPLCFMFSVVNSISRFIPFRRKPNATPRKILFIKLSEIGSIILSYSLIDLARKEYPQAKIFFLTFERNKSIFELLKVIPEENILIIRESPPHLFIWDTLRVIRKLNREKIDIAFDLELFSRFTAILAYLSSADKRIGFYRYHFEGLYRGNLLTHNIGHNPLIHISKSFLSLWQVVAMPEKMSPELERKVEDREITLPKASAPKETIEQMYKRLSEFGVNDRSKIFLINPGDGMLPLREWPLENFIVLSKKILEDGKNYLIIVGKDENSKDRKSLLLYDALKDKRCINLCNNTTLSELLALFYMAVALIANDSGVTHISSLTPVKKFIFFGPESPQIYSPLGENNWIIYSDFPCSPCFSAFNHRNSSCRDNNCLKAIKPEQVFALLKNHL
ncbi:MAG: glycosyltransferase family 9 protein [Candidatus Omnitrophica bacterium]|nr:glycosyltransferase family 9 protein [Candidatus Omnitrophota bacterium]MDD5352522.1 glycosyltransferase family 9 protein [Candidatus Omnitrophota bacterium]MDD5550120.1 glycosyltransferase family 9 protein [Candidatus Omnitrophota bacterium]